MSVLFPLATWSQIDNGRADRLLVEWGHFLGACDRPYGIQSFGLLLEGDLVAVAVSASTVGTSCGGFPRRKVVELARLCSEPGHQELTRVALRLWRVTAPALWSAAYWPVEACVSYANATRHKGDVYRFDGWRKVAESRAGSAGGPRAGNKTYDRKSVWVFPLSEWAAAEVNSLAEALQTEE